MGDGGRRGSGDHRRRATIDRRRRPGATQVIERILRAIATRGLPGSPEGPIDVPGGEWPSVSRALERERLTGLARSLLSDGTLRLDDESAERLVDLDALWSAHTLRAEDVLIDLGRELQERSIDFRVLKGSALAELSWTIGEARRWVDADVLVPSDRFDEVIALCLEDGAIRPVSELRAGHDRRFAKSVTLRSSLGPEIDLHRALVLGPHTFLIPAADLFDRPRLFSVEDLQLSTLSAEATLIHCCLHATIAGASRLATLRDIVESYEGTDDVLAAGIAERWHVRPMVVAAGEAVARRLSLPAHPFVTWSRTLEPTAEELRIASVYARDNRSNRNLAIASIRHIPGRSDRLRFMVAMAFPSAANRADRGRSWTDQFRRIRPR
ncbi:nucleotidyltransferase family protein [Actinospongicola halichondriae]|uniref:nucleotidyltransferase family protein n=1 Tax=Actinospongicola halichondriae TaxID=3236844 RepID=UPI003D3A3DCA